ncbi:MAG: 16S rRNA (guanine(966)-N(2))-methyltransferase RsmD [Clostridia bacterium]|nr:16S rRNA (guanine(966)-N(2))-methyltransferase RsmD [Clostridia bacterium]
MRVITGKARGKKLAAPEGYDTRPTTDRVKESIFNIIQFDIEGRHALDLFCGSGQLGIEALSRGAYSCVFADMDRKAADIARKNIANCGFTEQSEVYCGDGVAMLSRMKKGRFGLIFLDPPYHTELISSALSKICTLDLLAQGGIIICETERGIPFPELPAPYRVLKEYNYGKTVIITVTRDGEEKSE